MTATIINLSDVRSRVSIKESLLESGDKPSSLRVRRARRTEWWKAEGVLALYEALRDLHLAATSDRVAGNELAKTTAIQNRFVKYDDEDVDGIKERDLFDCVREATAELIRTPAPTRAEITWKRKQLPNIKYNPFITLDEGQRAIERDEAWHADYPARRSTPRS